MKKTYLAIIVGFILFIGMVLLVFKNSFDAGNSSKKVAVKDKPKFTFSTGDKKNLEAMALPMPSPILKTEGDNFSKSQETPIGVFYLDLNGDLTNEAKTGALKAINNLKVYGSTSGGVITHEFQDLEYSRNQLKTIGGLQGLLGTLSFKPYDTQKILDPSLILTGTRSTGILTEKKGFGSVYRLYESGNGLSLEMNETYIEPSNASIYTFKELYNEKVLDVPVSLEQLKSDKFGNITNINWFSNQREYGISSNLPKEKILDIVGYIIAHPAQNPVPAVLSSQEQKLRDEQIAINKQTNPFSLPSVGKK